MKKVLIAIVVVLFSPFLAFANPTIVGTVVNWTATSAATTYGLGNLTTSSGNGSNQCVIVEISSGNGPPSDTTSVKWNGATLTQIASVGGSQQAGLDVWYIATTTSVTAGISLTRSVNSFQSGAWAFALQDCAQSSPFDVSGHSTAASGSSDSVTISLAAATEVVFNNLALESLPNPSPVPSAGQTQIGNVLKPANGGNANFALSSKPASAIGNITTGWSWTTGGADDYDMFAYGIKCSSPCPSSSVGSIPPYFNIFWW